MSYSKATLSNLCESDCTKWSNGYEKGQGFQYLIEHKVYKLKSNAKRYILRKSGDSFGFYVWGFF